MLIRGPKCCPVRGAVAGVPGLGPASPVSLTLTLPCSGGCTNLKLCFRPCCSFNPDTLPGGLGPQQTQGHKHWPAVTLLVQGQARPTFHDFFWKCPQKLPGTRKTMKNCMKAPGTQPVLAEDTSGFG